MTSEAFLIILVSVLAGVLEAVCLDKSNNSETKVGRFLWAALYFGIVITFLAFITFMAAKRIVRS